MKRLLPLVIPGADPEKVQAAVPLCEEVAGELWTRCERGVGDACQWYKKLREGLRADGLDLVRGHLAVSLSPGVDIPKVQGPLESRLEALRWAIPLNRWRQAVDNAAAGNWEAANRQIRSFLESVCNEIANTLYTGKGSVPSAGEARKYMVNAEFLDQEEGELLKALFAILHRAGSHAGISDEADCHRRRMMALALANYYLDRLERRVG